jgi:acyl phosphate:glycerol-3-phosphate acyltransferase
MVVWLAINAGLLLLSYLLGSIPTGYLMGRSLKGIDIREHGSGSTGATNVLRTLGKGPGLIVLLIDVLKGAAAIALVGWVYQQSFIAVPAEVDLYQWLPWMTVLAAMMAILGHSKSVWLGFTGGKSVATGLGILLALHPLVGLATLGIFLLFLAVSRIVSLSSIAGAIALPFLSLLTSQPLPYILFVLVGAAYVVGRHHQNIRRLLAGTEPRLGETLATEASAQSSQSVLSSQDSIPR